MRSGEVASKRRRGVVLTLEGQQKLRAAIAQIQDDEYDGQKLTIEELSGRTRLDPGTVSKVLDAEQGVDRRTLRSFFQTLNLELVENDYCKAESSLGNGLSESQLAVVPSIPESAVDLQIDWGEAPDVSIFYGRTDELDQLEQWIVGDRCRLITVLGMGGIGKTSLAARLIERLVGGRNQGFRTASVNALPERQSTSEFEYVVWYSLRNAPTIEEALSYLTRFLNGQSGAVLPKSLDSLISLLLQRLEQSRCLVVLDNTESILRGGERVGAYRDGYAGYGELIRRVGEAPHQSCLILTSREKPREVGLLEGQARPIRSLQLSGLQLSDGVKILTTEGLSEGGKDQQQLLDRYSGNPLALKIAANAIHEYFGGDVANFFTDGATMFGDIRDLLDSQFERLAALDREVMYWLAINREPVTFAELMEEIVSPIKRPQLLEALESLLRRSLIERSQVGFTLQNVVMEYVTDRFVELVGEELRNSKLELFHTHALIKTTVKDYVRKTQVRLILKPIADATPTKWQEWLQACRSQLQLSSGYAPGNLLNLLCYSSQEIKDYDFSGLTIRNAYLKGVSLQNVNFAGTNFIKPALIEPFTVALSVVFSPDGTLLAAGGSEGEISLWRVADFQHLATYRGHANWVRSIAFSPNGKQLASGGEDNTVRLWDIDNQQCLRLLEGHAHWVFSIAFSPCGNRLVSGGADHTIRLWNVHTGQCLKTIDGYGSGYIFTVAFSPDGTMVASGSADRVIRLWSLKTQQCLQALEGHQSQIWTVAFSHDGKRLASGSNDHTARLWDVETGQCLSVLEGHQGDVRSVAFNVDGKIVATSGTDHTIRLWQVASGQCRAVLQDHTNRVLSVSFSPNGKTLASGSDDHTIRLWQVETRQCIYQLQGYTNQVWSVAFGWDGNRLATGHANGTVWIWDGKTQRYLYSLKGHQKRVEGIAFSADGKWLVSGSSDRTVRLWDLKTHQCRYVFRGHANAVRSVCFSPDGRLLASSSNDRTIRLWDVTSGHELAVLQGHTHWVVSIAFSPDGTLLASSGVDGTIRLWQVSKPFSDRVLQGQTGQVYAIAFSPDGRWLVSGSDDQLVRVWDVQTGQCLQVLEGHHNRVSSVAVSSDGKTIASGSNDHTVRLWNGETGRCLQVLKGHCNQVWSVAFSPNGEWLASGSADETVRLWNVSTGEYLTSLLAPRPYEGVNIEGIMGLTEAQRTALIALGAVE